MCHNSILIDYFILIWTSFFVNEISHQYIETSSFT